MKVEKSQTLKAHHLGKSYGLRPVIRDVSLEISRGEAVGLLGPNGAGKTSCFYMICGLIKPDYGNITLYEEDITFLPMYKRARMGIGYLPQETSVFRGLNVAENIMAIIEIAQAGEVKKEQILDELLAEFSITHLRYTPAIALSGGERRRVEIARALAAKPDFMLLDEPLAGIDPIAVLEIKKLILHLKQRNIGVLITDHNVKDTLDIVDRAYIIHDGKVLMQGLASEIINNQDVRKVYLGEDFVL